MFHSEGACVACSFWQGKLQVGGEHGTQEHARATGTKTGPHHVLAAVAASLARADLRLPLPLSPLSLAHDSPLHAHEVGEAGDLSRGEPCAACEPPRPPARVVFRPQRGRATALLSRGHAAPALADAGRKSSGGFYPAAGDGARRGVLPTPLAPHPPRGGDDSAW